MKIRASQPIVSERGESAKDVVKAPVGARVRVYPLIAPQAFLGPYMGTVVAVEGETRKIELDTGSWPFKDGTIVQEHESNL